MAQQFPLSSTSMNSAQLINQGDLYWARIDKNPETTAGIAHPHVVVQDNLFNHSRIDSVVVCSLTTNQLRFYEPGNVLLDLGEAGLPKQSAVVVSQINSVAKNQLGEYIGTLSTERIAQILAGIRFQQMAFFERS